MAITSPLKLERRFTSLFSNVFIQMSHSRHFLCSFCTIAIDIYIHQLLYWHCLYILLLFFFNGFVFYFSMLSFCNFFYFILPIFIYFFKFILLFFNFFLIFVFLFCNCLSYYHYFPIVSLIHLSLFNFNKRTSHSSMCLSFSPHFFSFVFVLLK